MSVSPFAAANSRGAASSRLDQADWLLFRRVMEGLSHLNNGGAGRMQGWRETASRSTESQARQSDDAPAKRFTGE
jgi:hypothetical protein